VQDRQTDALEQYEIAVYALSETCQSNQSKTHARNSMTVTDGDGRRDTTTFHNAS